MKFCYDIERDEERLVSSCESGNVETVRNLLSLRLADVNFSIVGYFHFARTPMGQAAINGRNEVIKVSGVMILF